MISSLISLTVVAMLPLHITVQSRAPSLRPSQVTRLANVVKKEAKKNGLRPELLLAVIEVESMYNVTAKSSVGCIGLMQLKPKTAKYVAKDTKLKYWNLGKIEHNVILGSKYLKRMISRFGRRGGLTAYNRGPGAYLKGGKKNNYYSKLVIRVYNEIVRQRARELVEDCGS